MTRGVPLDQSEEEMTSDTRGCFQSPTRRDSLLTAPEETTAVTQTVSQSMQLQQTYLIIALMRGRRLISISLSQAWKTPGTWFNFLGIHLPPKLGHNMPLIGESSLQSVNWDDMIIPG